MLGVRAASFQQLHPLSAGHARRVMPLGSRYPWSSYKVCDDNDSVAVGDHEVLVGSRRCHRGGVRG